MLYRTGSNFNLVIVKHQLTKVPKFFIIVSHYQYYQIGQLLKAFGSNYFAQISHILRQFL